MLPFSTSQVFHPKFSKSKWIDKQVFKQKRKKGKKRFKKRGQGRARWGGGGLEPRYELWYINLGFKPQILEHLF